MTDAADEQSEMVGVITKVISEIMGGSTDDRAIVSDSLRDVVGLDGVRWRSLSDRVARAKSEVARLRRRESELGALFLSARELAAVRDSDSLIKRIVERAHSMIDSDLTYLSEFRPDTDELFVRETVGSISAHFQSLRVPPGKGLASMVVQNRTGVSTSRYAEFEAARHDTEIDEAVRGEGLVALLGVPMLADDEVLGVLFAGRREPHEFSIEDTALMTALANHASVVLQTARMLRELERAQDASKQAVSRLSKTLVQRDRAHAVHRNLMEAVLRGGGFATVVQTLSDELSRPVMLIDDSESVLAEVGDWTRAPALVDDEGTAEALRKSAESGRYVSLSAGEVSGVSTLVAGDRKFGAIILGPGEAPLDDVDSRTVERAAMVGALVALSEEAVAASEYRVQRDIIEDLLSPDVDRSQVEARARTRGFDVAGVDSMLVLSAQTAHNADVVRVTGSITPGAVLAAEYSGLVVVVGSRQIVDNAVDLHREISSRAHTEVSMVIAPPGDLPVGFAAAHRVALLLRALNVGGAVVRTEEYLLYASVFDADAQQLDGFIEGQLSPVKVHDEKKGADLLRTLLAYVHHGGSPSRTARALNFHVNTISQRLERIDSLLGPDWRDDEPYFRLSAALRLDELRSSLRSRKRRH